MSTIPSIILQTVLPRYLTRDVVYLVTDISDDLRLKSIDQYGKIKKYTTIDELEALSSIIMQRDLSGINAINISGGPIKYISLQIDNNDKVLTQSETGLLANIALSSITQSSGSVYAHQYCLIGKDGEQLGNTTIDILKDQYLSGTYYDKASHTLIFKFYTATGEISTAAIDLTDLVNIYTAESGVQMIDSTVGKKFVGQIDNNSELDYDNNAYLTVNQYGFKVNGIKNSINKITNIMSTSVSENYLSLTGGIINGDITADNYYFNNNENITILSSTGIKDFNYNNSILTITKNNNTIVTAEIPTAYLPLTGGIINGQLKIINNISANNFNYQGNDLFIGDKINPNLYDKGLTGSYLPLTGGTVDGQLNVVNIVSAANYKYNDNNLFIGDKINPLLYDKGLTGSYLPLTGGIINGELTANNYYFNNGKDITILSSTGIKDFNYENSILTITKNNNTTVTTEIPTAYLPLTGGTVDGQLNIINTVSASNYKYNNNELFIGDKINPALYNQGLTGDYLPLTGGIVNGQLKVISTVSASNYKYNDNDLFIDNKINPNLYDKGINNVLTISSLYPTNANMTAFVSGGLDVTSSYFNFGTKDNIYSKLNVFTINIGTNNTVSGYVSYAHGKGNKALGRYSVADGYNTVAYGDASQAYGCQTITSGNYSHAEGAGNKALNTAAHAEGEGTAALGGWSHTEGKSTYTVGSYSHAEGEQTSSIAPYSHAEGAYTIANSSNSHAEGLSTISNGTYSHAEGSSTNTIGSYSHAEGSDTKAQNTYSHAEGLYTVSNGQYSHTEGQSTKTTGKASHSQGYFTNAVGSFSHTEGQSVSAMNSCSHAEGRETITKANNSHAEGWKTSTNNTYSHAEGQDTQTFGQASHAEGLNTKTNSAHSHAEGYNTETNTQWSHAEGYGTKTSLNDNSGSGDRAQHVEGRWNKPLSGYQKIIGNGTSDSDRKNIYTLDWSGNQWLSGTISATNYFNSNGDKLFIDNKINPALYNQGLSGDYLPLTGGIVNGQLKVISTVSASNYKYNDNDLFIDNKINPDLYDKGLSGDYLPLTGGIVNGQLKVISTVSASNYKYNDNDLFIGEKINPTLYEAGKSGQYLPISGGTLTGDLTVQTNLSANTINTTQVLVNQIDIASALTKYDTVTGSSDISISLTQHNYLTIPTTVEVNTITFTKFANDSCIKFNAAVGCTANITASKDGWFINKVFDFSEGGQYFVLCENNVIVWTHLVNVQ